MSLVVACGDAIDDNPTSSSGGPTVILDQIPSAVTVELDIFSGRPNPSWLLADEQIPALMDRLRALESAAGGSIAAPLGYRGLIVRLDGGEPRVVTIQAGTVELQGAAGVGWARDTDRQLERWLIDQGRSTLAPEVAQVVDDSLGR